MIGARFRFLSSSVPLRVNGTQPPLTSIRRGRVALTRLRHCRAMNSEIDEDPLGQFCPVPLDQQPIHELKELQEILLFDWATLPFPEFIKKLALLWAGFCIISFPVSAASFDPQLDPIPFFVAGSCGSLFVVLVVVFRLFLGWSHVGSRLQSETVEYEESGWYDGQIWVKTEECLTRDRLASTFTVKPALQRIETTLWTVSGSFISCLILLSFIQPSYPLPPQTVDGLSFIVKLHLTLSLYSVLGMYTRASPKETYDYWKRVQKFEPWLFDGEDTRTDPMADCI